MSQVTLSRILSNCYLVKRVLARPIPIAHRCLGTVNKAAKNPQTTQEDDEHIKNEPLKYFNSAASRWKAEQTRSGQTKQDMPWYQPYVVNLSVAIFLLYFCVLREENDIDRGLEKSLYDHIPGLEHKQLIMNYNYNKEHGMSTLEIEQRMKELGIEY